MLLESLPELELTLTEGLMSLMIWIVEDMGSAMAEMSAAVVSTGIVKMSNA